MAHPGKDSVTEEDWFMENCVKSATWRGQRSLATWVIEVTEFKFKVTIGP